ncbi:MAG: AraC family transcriptional regulator [Oscillospiraceae bacterium]|nr:AraC family transcriptional regulator [Oscillospiraceae bacterium]
MEDINIIRKLVGEDLTQQQLAYVDCYVDKKLGLFIPSTGQCGYARKDDHVHPSYMAVIDFSEISSSYGHYGAYIYSPGIPHSDSCSKRYYCVMIEKKFFESQFLLYSKKIPVFAPESFVICSDILKALNTFAFEYSKSMMNSDITLAAQSVIITHWIIRSILGETLDMRPVSSDYCVARAQQYIELHYPEKITSDDLARLGYVSVSSLNRRFKEQTGQTPAQYIIDVRIQKSKLLLARRNMSLTEIAQKCGFSSSAHFSSTFSLRTGIKPSEYQSSYFD